MAHSKRDSLTITRNTASPLGNPIPPFVGMAHRHFEKSPPEQGKRVGHGMVEYAAPIDMVRLTCPAPLVEPFTALILGYKEQK